MLQIRKREDRDKLEEKRGRGRGGGGGLREESLRVLFKQTELTKKKFIRKETTWRINDFL